MTKCSACNAAIAKVEVLDIENSALAKKTALCADCAKGLSGQPPVSKLTVTGTVLSAELIESLFGGANVDPVQFRSGRENACPGCNMSAAEFRLRGRLGCPRCYETFRASLLPLLERVHDSNCHRGRRPALVQDAPPLVRNTAAAVDLRDRLRTAIDEERYEDAARLRDKLEQLERERRDSDA